MHEGRFVEGHTKFDKVGEMFDNTFAKKCAFGYLEFHAKQNEAENVPKTHYLSVYKCIS